MIRRLYARFNANLNMFERVLYMTLAVYSIAFTVYLFKREVNFIHDEEMYWMGRRWLNEETRKLDKCERVRNYYRRRLAETLESSTNTSAPNDLIPPVEMPELSTDHPSVEVLDEPEGFESPDVGSNEVGTTNALVKVEVGVYE